MYKVVSRIVLALKSPSGLSVEIRGRGQQRWGMGCVEEMGPALHWGDEDVEKVTPVSKLQPPILVERLVGEGESVRGTSKAIAF